jgi:hypothetical protein
MKKLFIALAILSTSLLLAQGGQKGDRPEREKGKPPQEAITACEGKSAGSSCEMTGRRGETLNGTCADTPDGKYFACKPEGMPPRR